MGENNNEINEIRLPYLCPICGAPLIQKKRGRWRSGGFSEVINIGVGSSENYNSFECSNNKKHKFHAWILSKERAIHIIRTTWIRKYEYSEAADINYGSLSEEEKRIFYEAIENFPHSVEKTSYVWIIFPQTSTIQLSKFKGFWIVFENYKIDGLNISFKFGFIEDEADRERKKYILRGVYPI
ncbi:MAG: hypothetical protein J7J42_07565 [Thermoplasmata archaeon]|nr:hypothetical protein [Thermoplasmata archaeon]